MDRHYSIYNQSSSDIRLNPIANSPAISVRLVGIGEYRSMFLHVYLSTASLVVVVLKNIWEQLLQEARKEKRPRTKALSQRGR
ncbi:hypothetical protein AAHA92_15762 [Salvia divinorum]|uniref:Uncharacterized protein n=1 Tax=Salvia divinorum TaxID=28513 RepID=A0ABD1HFR8_SALDI